MSVILTINGIPFEFPSQGQEPPWGEQVTDWATAITNAFSGTNSPGDILTTVFNPQNISTNAVVGLSFDSSLVQGFVADYSIYRSVKTSLNVVQQEAVETGTIHGAYLIGSANWSISIVGNSISETEITLSIDNTGQIQYSSSNWTVPIGGTHNCRMVFRARSFSQS